MIYDMRKFEIVSDYAFYIDVLINSQGFSRCV